MTREWSRDMLVREYEPSEVGARIGWSEVVVSEDRPELVELRGAVATVGEGGASVSVCEDRKVYHSSLVHGLSEACSWSLHFIRDEPVLRRNLQSLFDENALSQMHGAGFHPRADIEADTVQWGEGGDIMANIREGLQHVGLAERYPTAYFAINTLIGHRQQQSKYTYVSRQELEGVVLPDASMATFTSAESDSANAYKEQLQTRYKDATGIAKQLESLTIAPRAVADDFEVSRESARNLYLAQVAIAGAMHWSGSVVLSEGHLRTWPYMDVSESDREKSYGRELRNLEMNNGYLALDELHREEKELQVGIAFVQKSINTLNALSIAEQ